MVSSAVMFEINLIFMSLCLPIFTIANSNTFLAAADFFTNGTSDPWVSMESTIIIPDLPSLEWQNLYIWPGLQPQKGDPNYEPLKLGVLQSVISFAPSHCAPNIFNRSIDYKNSWWITPMYANVETNLSKYFLCHAGDRMAVSSGNALQLLLRKVAGTNIWRQTIINLSSPSLSTISWDIDLKGQAQSMAIWAMEFAGGNWRLNPPKWDVLNITLKSSGNGSSSSFCNYQQVLVSEEEAPEISLECTNVIKNGSICFTSRCSFNKHPRLHASKTGRNVTIDKNTTSTSSYLHPSLTPTPDVSIPSGSSSSINDSVPNENIPFKSPTTSGEKASIVHSSLILLFSSLLLAL